MRPDERTRRPDSAVRNEIGPGIIDSGLDNNDRRGRRRRRSLPPLRLSLLLYSLQQLQKFSNFSFHRNCRHCRGCCCCCCCCCYVITRTATTLLLLTPMPLCYCYYSCCCYGRVSLPGEGVGRGVMSSSQVPRSSVCTDRTRYRPSRVARYAAPNIITTPTRHYIYCRQFCKIIVDDTQNMTPPRVGGWFLARTRSFRSRSTVVKSTRRHFK